MCALCLCGRWPLVRGPHKQAATALLAGTLKTRRCAHCYAVCLSSRAAGNQLVTVASGGLYTVQQRAAAAAEPAVDARAVVLQQPRGTDDGPQPRPATVVTVTLPGADMAPGTEGGGGQKAPLGAGGAAASISGGGQPEAASTAAGNQQPYPPPFGDEHVQSSHTAGGAGPCTSSAEGRHVSKGLRVALQRCVPRRRRGSRRAARWFLVSTSLHSYWRAATCLMKIPSIPLCTRHAPRP
jgi:hypothetical protein